jgi:hypothetical protein
MHQAKMIVTKKATYSGACMLQQQKTANIASKHGHVSCHENCTST